ncbi:MAG: glycine cleavage system protein GcvH [archaeon]
MQVGDYNIKEGLYYLDSHEWVEIKGNTATIGLSDYAQKSLGDVAYIDVPQVGKEVSQKAELCEIESVKAVDHVYSPLSGKVVGANSELTNSPDKINSDPYGAWIVKIEIKDESEKANLKDANAYAEFVKGLAAK